ncbi:hypothetical protein WME98_14105 [Sorangium sp. So ce296]|uniref:Secreted protein n=1 Tax=Sorangium cellulosum TaxID=56 RepID=A0A150RYU9_SORCE|nr:hypothetical protein BE18_29990 [Sorangium cellulosum]KYF98784.1 hypothetical protein BE20_33750 [Sorangium cellulosum]
MKVMTRMALAALALAALALAACSSGHGEEGCPELCERAVECPGAPMTEDSCLDACGAETEQAEEAGCEDAWESYLECRNHAEDNCDPAKYEEECSIQLESLNSCLQRS